MIRPPLRRPALMVAVASLVACTDDPPTVCSHIPQQLLLVGQLAELPPCFEDPEGEELVLSAESSNVETATVLVSDSAVTIRAVDAGTATVTYHGGGSLRADGFDRRGRSGRRPPQASPGGLR